MFDLLIFLCKLGMLFIFFYGINGIFLEQIKIYDLIYQFCCKYYVKFDVDLKIEIIFYQFSCQKINKGRDKYENKIDFYFQNSIIVVQFYWSSFCVFSGSK